MIHYIKRQDQRDIRKKETGSRSKDQKGSFQRSLKRQKLSVVSRETRIEATAGESHLLVNGKENLMDGAPYVNDMGILVMEVNAVIPHIAGTVCQYDERVQVLRIERRGDI